MNDTHAVHRTRLAGSRGSGLRDRKRPPHQGGKRANAEAEGSAATTAAQHSLPFEVVTLVLQEYATLSPTCALNAMLISKSLASAVEQSVFGSVSLFSVRGVECFQQLLKRRPQLGRRVHALWIAPGRSDSDLIPALAPPTSNPALEARQRKLQSNAREILRSCRKLTHLALDGGFLTPQCAVGFGTAAKPRTLLCVNPHSFLGHFSAPIFRHTVRRLEVVDTTLAVEEVDEIRQMVGLHHFIWTAPRANSDVTRDVSVLLRILSPRGRDAVAALEHNDDGTDTAAAEAAAEALEQERRLIELVAQGGTAPPEKARQNADLRSICTVTSQARASALAASFKKIVETVELAAEEEDDVDVADEEDRDLVRAMRAMKAGFYVDSSRANSTSLHKPTGVELQTQALSSLMQALSHKRGGGRAKAVRESGEDDNESESEEEDDDEIVDEWEALRDVVCQRRTANSNASSRLFAGLASGTSSSNASFRVVNRGADGFGSTNVSTGVNSAVSTPAWGLSRAPSPTRHSAVHSSASGTSTPHQRYEEEIDGGRALQRVWRRWKQQVDQGDLDMYL